jgi:isocitrate dehydrogenase
MYVYENLNVRVAIIIKKTSITNVFKNKFNKKINDKFKKITKKLFKDNKNKKYFVKRKF